jgi:hypothetical protein
MTEPGPSISERILDAAIECTFPASDPVAIQDAFAAARAREQDAIRPSECAGNGPAPRAG